MKSSADRRLFRWSLLLVAALTAGVPGVASFAQAPVVAEKPLAFEVVSIRQDSSSVRGQEQVEVRPDGWHVAHTSLMAALLTAYVPTTKDSMIYTVSTLSGVPDWMQTERYSIDAKVPESELAAWQNPATQLPMLRRMVQAMLADRCKLVVHRGIKEVTVYSLVVGKNGPKLKAADLKDGHPGAIQIPGGGEFLPNDGSGNASLYGAPMGALAVLLSNFGGRPVEDRTGLTGRYDMSFRRPRPGGPSIEPDSTSNPPPSIFEVAESFGLKLETAKSSVETLVVDHIEKPSEN